MPETFMHAIGCTPVDTIDFTVDLVSENEKIQNLLRKFTVAPE
jgi:hypothetical protein